jgi:lipopolysaccharide heptosyltransferase I
MRFTRSPQPNLVKRALIVRLGSLGDVVHAIPVAASLRSAYPSAQIDWVTDPMYLPLIGLVEGVDRAIGLNTRAWLPGARGNVVSALAALRRSAYDVVLDLQGLLKSAILARAVGARRTVGFSRTHLREPAARLFYSESVNPGGAVHVIQQNLSVSAALGALDRSVRFPVRVPESAAAADVARELGGGFALLNPGGSAAWPNKRWPPSRFGAVAQALERSHGLPSIVWRGPGEQALAEAVAVASGGAARVSPPMSLPDLLALAHASRVMVSGDTGPLHLAAAVGTPVVALFGPTRPERNGPWAAADVSVSRVTQCECPYQRRCRRREPCIEDIGVEEVLEAVARRLGAHV